MASRQLIKAIYAMGTSLGINGGSREDNLHELVSAVTGKESIASLTDREARQVQNELMRRMKGNIRPKSACYDTKHMNIPPDKMNEGQKKKAWALIYKLCELDPSDAAPSERMRGAVKKILGMDILMDCKNPFRMISAQQGVRLIDTLKRYVSSVQKKRDGS